MRLTCPNCGAQYEVARDAVPTEGRDVQCSNCGVTWLAMPEPATEPQGTVSPPGPRSTITPEIAEILRAEAEREAAARKRGGAAGAQAATDQPPQATASPFEDEDDDAEIDFVPDDGGLRRGESLGRRLDSGEIWDEEENDEDVDWAAFAATQSAASRETATPAEPETIEPAELPAGVDAREDDPENEAARDELDDASAVGGASTEAAMRDATAAPGDAEPGDDTEDIVAPAMETDDAAPLRPEPEEDDLLAPALGDDDDTDMAFDDEPLEGFPEPVDFEQEQEQEHEAEAAPFDATEDLDDSDAEIEQDPFLRDDETEAEKEELAEPAFLANELDDLDAEEPLPDDPAEEPDAQRLSPQAADEEPEDDPFESPSFDEDPSADARPRSQEAPAATERDALVETEEDDPFGQAVAAATGSVSGRPFDARDEEPGEDSVESMSLDEDRPDDAHPEWREAARRAVTEREALTETEEDDPFARAMAEAAQSDAGTSYDARDEEPETGSFAEPAEAPIDDDLDEVPPQPMQPEAQEASDDPRAEARQRATLAAASTGAVTRRDLLPDIEEINSSLRSTSMRGGPGRPVEAEDVQRGRGFRLGFGVALLFAAALALVYSHAGRIGMALPPLAPALDAYAGTIDAIRTGLDTWLRGLIDALG